MKKTFSNILFFTLVAVVFFIAVLINNMFSKGINIDLTQEQIYSLSAGSEKIIKGIKEPINLYFFFSQSTSSGMTSLRDYASRVESMLREYEFKSGGRINLEIIDPEPFSEAQDRAASFGLTAAPTGLGEDSVYFGLAGTNALDDGMIIGFFDPQKEAFLEYDISKLIYQLSEPQAIKLTLLTDLEVAGGQSPLTGQDAPPYVLYQQLSTFFELELISSSDTALPQQTEVLMVLHPQNISAELSHSIDQFLMKGGKALFFIDPHFESDPMAQMGSVGANSSSFNLLEHYGIKVNTAEVVLDAQTGLEVLGSEEKVIRHLGFLGLDSQYINKDDIASADLDSINGASFGYIELLEGNQLKSTDLLLSSLNTSTMLSLDYAGIRDPENLNADFVNHQTQRVLASRIYGPAKSILNNNSSNQSEALGSEYTNFVKQTDNLHLVVIADADIAADRFWVQQSNFFGQAVFSPFANNGDLIINVLENLGGSEGLIGIRSRGTFARPFTKVQGILVKAEEKFREQEQLLQTQLEETEAQILQLQNQSNSLTLSAGQQKAIDTFTKHKIQIRKSLREVQFQLDKDIDALGNKLKLINIAIAPLLIVLLLFGVAKISAKRAKL